MSLYDDDDELPSQINQPSNSSRLDDEPPTKKRLVALDDDNGHRFSTATGS